MFQIAIARVTIKVIFCAQEIGVIKLNISSILTAMVLQCHKNEFKTKIKYT